MGGARGGAGPTRWDPVGVKYLGDGRETVGEPERRGGGVASRLDWTAELQRSQRAASRGTVVELGGVVSLGYCSLIIHLTH